MALVFLVGCTLLLILLLWSGHGHFSLFRLTPILGMAIFICDYLSSKILALQLAHRCGFYERGIERVRMNWDALARTGQEFAREDHLYQSDLQILGERSLFSILCTTRSQAGAARLADFLLQPADLKEVIDRQDAVRELRASTTLREEIALLGKHHFLEGECDHKLLRGWRNAPLLRVHSVTPVFLFVCGFTSLLLATLCLVQLLSWMHTLPILIPLLAAQLAAVSQCPYPSSNAAAPHGRNVCTPARAATAGKPAIHIPQTYKPG
jgi:hypothetical protein